MFTVYLTLLKNRHVPKTLTRPRSFQNTLTIKTGVSDFHEMVITTMKVFYEKQKPKIIQYRS